MSIGDTRLVREFLEQTSDKGQVRQAEIAKVSQQTISMWSGKIRAGEDVDIRKGESRDAMNVYLLLAAPREGVKKTFYDGALAVIEDMQMKLEEMAQMYRAVARFEEAPTTQAVSENPATEPVRGRDGLEPLERRALDAVRAVEALPQQKKKQA